MHASSARMYAGILQPARAPASGRCLHCSLPVAGGCRCALPDDRRRPDLEGAPAFERWPAVGAFGRAFA